MKHFLRRLLAPAAITFLVMFAYLGVVFTQADNDPYVFVRIGEKYQLENSEDLEGYDGQFVYFIARELSPGDVAPLLDVPAYRYQRILLPLLARLLSFGNAAVIPWLLIAIGAASHLFGVYVVSLLLEKRGSNRWFALVYGLWAGFLLSVRLDLPEPLAYLLVALAILSGEQKPILKWVFLGLAVFAKEVAILFVAGQLIHYFFKKEWLRAAGLTTIGLIPFALFQLWLRSQFGAFGIGSGGAMATGFEIIPFMGWFRIAQFSWPFFIVYGLILVPFFYVPALWAVKNTVRNLVKAAKPEAAFLFTNAVVIPFLPFSTVREPGGLFRFGCGLVLSLLIYAAGNKEKKALGYSMVWLALSVIIFNA